MMDDFRAHKVLGGDDRFPPTPFYEPDPKQPRGRWLAAALVLSAALWALAFWGWPS